MKTKNKRVKMMSILTAIISIALAFAFIACEEEDKGNNGNNGNSNTAVTLSTVVQDGSATQTTTQLTLTFSQAITGLAAGDITLTGVPNVAKGTLSASGATYTLPISGFIVGGTLNVAVAKSGYTVSGSPKTVRIYAPWTAVTDTTSFGRNIIKQGIAWCGPAENQKFVAVGGSKMAYSVDGVTWNVVNTNVNYPTFYDIAWGGSVGNEKFVAVGITTGVGTIAAYSTDLVNWSFLSKVDTKFDQYTTTFANASISSIAWGGPVGDKKFVAVGSQYQAAYSADGVTWTTIPDIKLGTTVVSGEAYSINGIAWGETAGKFVAVDDRGKVAYSADGVTWTAVTDPKFGTTDNIIYGIAWGGTVGNEKFVAVGYGGKAAYSADGVTWTAVTDTTFGSNTIWGIAWGGTTGNERFVAVGYSKAAYSTDGITWTAIPDTTFSYGDDIKCIAWGGTAGNEKFVAVGGSLGNGSKAAYWDK